MRQLQLTRIAFLPTVTVGQMSVAGRRIYTIERPWLDNLPFVSCIPDGTYLCVPRRFNRGGYDAIEVTGVPDRTEIKFHLGNWPWNFEGCIGPNSRLAPDDGSLIRGVDSQSAFDLLMAEYGAEEFELEISSADARLCRSGWHPGSA